MKPFSPGEVMARIRAVMQRIPAGEKDETLVIGTLSVQYAVAFGHAGRA
ncbi:MAG: hypothetical protein V8Q79_03495 [Christensenellales bacterium]